MFINHCYYRIITNMTTKIFLRLTAGFVIFGSLLSQGTGNASTISRGDRIAEIAKAKADKIEQIGKVRGDFLNIVDDAKNQMRNDIASARQQDNSFDRRYDVARARFDFRWEKQ